jgi:hypothetical protein
MAAQKETQQILKNRFLNQSSQMVDLVQTPLNNYSQAFGARHSALGV